MNRLKSSSSREFVEFIAFDNLGPDEWSAFDADVFQDRSESQVRGV